MQIVWCVEYAHFLVGSIKQIMFFRNINYIFP